MAEVVQPIAEGNELVSFTDSTVPASSYDRVLATDSVASTDAVGLEVSKGVNDSSAVTDSVTIEVVRDPYDSIAVVDGVVTQLLTGATSTYFLQVDEVIDTPDTWPLINGVANVSFSTDAVVVSDSVTAEKLKGIFEHSDSHTFETKRNDQEFLHDIGAGGDARSAVASADADVSYYAETAKIRDEFQHGIQTNHDLLETALAVTDEVTAALDLTIAREVNDTIAVTDELYQVSVNGVLFGAAEDTVTETDQLTTETQYAREANDANSVTDSTAAGVEFAFTIDDTISVTDTTALEVTYERVASDAVSVTDSISVGDSEVDLNDTDSVTDQLATEANYVRAASDTDSVTDQLAASATFERLAEDTVSVTDAADILPDITVADSVSVTDAADILPDINVSDTDSITDSVTAGVEVTILVSDASSVTDTTSVELTFERATSDADAVTDSTEALFTGTYLVDVSDSISLTEALSAGEENAYELADADTVTDEVITGLAISITLSDTVAVTDTVARAHDANRLPSDTVSILDTVSTGAATAIEVADTISTTDQVTATMLYGVVIDDAFAVTDQVVRATDTNRILATDSLAATDGVVISGFADINDTVVVSEQMTVSTQYARTTSTDSVSTTDDIDIEIQLAISDLITISFFHLTQLTIEIDYERFQDDTLLLGVDSTATSFTYGRAASDADSVTDAVETAMVYGRLLADAVVVTESFPDPAEEYARAPADTSVVTDQVNISVPYVREAGDSDSVTDTAAASMTFSRVGLGVPLIITEQLAISFERSIYIPWVITITDQVGVSLAKDVTLATDADSVTDAMASAVAYGRSASDAITMDPDSVTIQRDLSRTVLDGVNVVDQLQVSLFMEIAVGDTDTVSDSVVREWTAVRTASDVDAVTDEVTRAQDVVRTASDTLAVTDQLLAERVLEFGDAATMTDSTALAMVYAVLPADSMAVLDLATPATSYVRALAQDSVSVSDQTIASLTFEVVVSDAITMGPDAVVAYFEVLYQVVNNDTLSVADSVNVYLQVPITPEELLAAGQRGIFIPDQIYTEGSVNYGLTSGARNS